MNAAMKKELNNVNENVLPHYIHTPQNGECARFDAHYYITSAYPEANYNAIGHALIKAMEKLEAHK